MTTSSVPPPQGLPPQPRQFAATPKFQLPNWPEAIGPTPLANSDAVADLLTELVAGKLSNRSETTAQQVFNLLIEHELYGLFVEAFEAFNRIQTDRAGQDVHGKSVFKSKLVLQLPVDWAPAGGEKMEAALGKLSVHTLIVEGPPGQDGKGGPVAAPAAVSPCVAAMLKGEVNTLEVRCAFTDAQSVAQALENSSLQCVELGSKALEFQYVDLPKKDLESHGVLMVGLVRCASLRELNLAHTSLLQLASKLESPGVGASSRLHTFRMTGDTAHVDSSSIGEWMNVLGQFKDMSTIDLKVSTNTYFRVLEDILKPLRELPCLSRLSLVGEAEGFNVLRNSEMLGRLCKVLTACPRIEAFSWDAGTIPGDAAAQLNRIYFTLSAGSASTRHIRTLLANPNCPLRVLKLGGMVDSPSDLLELVGVLAHNKSLRILDLSGCAMSIGAYLALMEAMLKNTTLEQILLPTDSASYYLEAGGHCHGFKPDASPLSLAFELAHNPDIPPARAKEAEDMLTPLREQLNPWAPQALIDRRRREALAVNAYPALASDVAHLMAAALGRGAGDFPVDVARGVVDWLGEERELRRVVRFSEVSTAVDHRVRRQDDMAKPLTQEVRRLVEMDNRDAVVRGLPSAPLEINKVDANGANVLLLQAVNNDDVEEVLRLRRAGAIDFKGAAAKASKSLAMSEALRTPIAESPTVTVTTTNATVISSTTGVTAPGAAPGASSATPQASGAAPQDPSADR